MYEVSTDRWEQIAPLPAASGSVAYDPQKDAWEQYAPMATPRHGLGAVALGDAIYVAGGGPVVGGGVQSAVHEAFTLG